MATNPFSLEGKIALITGGSYGIGFNIAKAFHEAGATIVFNDIKQELVDKGLASYKECGIDAHGYVCDVTNEAQVQELVAKNYELLFCRFLVEETNNPQEVDFLLVKDGKVLPIEVKSGASSTSHISLDRFLTKYKAVADHAYVIHTKDLRVDGNITYLPAYMTMFI